MEPAGDGPADDRAEGTGPQVDPAHDGDRRGAADRKFRGHVHRVSGGRYRARQADRTAARFRGTADGGRRADARRSRPPLNPGGALGPTRGSAGRRRARYLLPAATFFLPPLTRALKSAPARNLGTDDLATLMDAPVAGFRAVRAGRSVFSNTPNPVMATLSPVTTANWIVSRTAFTASVAVFLSPIRPQIASIRSRLFMSSLLRSPNWRSRTRPGR